MCVKAVDTCPFILDSVPDQYYKTQEMCHKTTDTCNLVFDSVPD